MDKVEAQRLVDNVLKDDSPSSLVAMRELSKKYRYNVPDVLAKAILDKLESYPSFIANPTQFDVLVRLANLVVYSRAAKSQKLTIEELLFVGLKHPSGKVRQNARMLSRNYSTFLGEEADPAEFLHKIESLIKEYEPKLIPAYIDNIAPSIYKSLVLVWHDTMASHQLWKKLDYQTRMMELDIPGFSYTSDQQDDSIAEDYYSMEDWRACLEDYVFCNDWPKFLQLLNKQEKLAIDLLKEALDSNQVDSSYLLRVIDLARSSEPELIADAVLAEVSADIWSRYEEPRSELLRRSDKIARAFQAMDNNAVIWTKKGNPFCRMLISVVLDEAYRAKPQLIDLISLFEGFVACHNEVDTIIEELLIPADQKVIDFARQYSNTLPPPCDFYTPRQVSHYILDWLFQINSNLFISKTPKQMAAVAWEIVSLRNPGLMVYGLENQKLADFAGWKSRFGLTSLTKRLNADLEYEMADPRILIIT